MCVFARVRVYMQMSASMCVCYCIARYEYDARLCVQSQYTFIHDVVRVMVERKMRDEQGRRAEYQNTGFRGSSLYESTYAYGEQQ